MGSFLEKKNKRRRNIKKCGLNCNNGKTILRDESAAAVAVALAWGISRKKQGGKEIKDR